MRNASPQHLSHGRRDHWDGLGVLLDWTVVDGGRLDLPAVFGNTQPVELEIGVGKGTFLLARSTGQPDINLMGLEYARTYCYYAADRVRRAGRSNVRLVATEAGIFVRRALPDECLQRVHIYFPDPWPKRKHHRRRLIQPPFVQELRRVLQAGGQLLVASDHQEYFQQIQDVLTTAEGFVQDEFPRMADADAEVVGTNFERKYIAQGRPIYKIACRRR